MVIPPPPANGAPKEDGEPIPARIDATGGDDVSAELGAHFTGLPRGAIALLPRGSRYRAEFGVLLNKRHDLTIRSEDPENPGKIYQTELEPYGAEHRENRNRMVLGFREGGDIHLQDIVLQGACAEAGYKGNNWRADLEAQHALLIAGVEGFIAEDLFLTEVAGDFVYITNRGSREDEPTIYSRDVTIRRCVFGEFSNAWVAGHGAGAAEVGDVEFSDCEIIGRPPVFQIRGRRSTAIRPGLRRSDVRVLRNRAHSIERIESGNLDVMEFTAVDGVRCVGNVLDFQGEKRPIAGAWYNESLGIINADNQWGNASITTGWPWATTRIRGGRSWSTTARAWSGTGCSCGHRGGYPSEKGGTGLHEPAGALEQIP